VRRRDGDEGAWVGWGPGGGELLRGVRGAREPQEEREEHLLSRLLHQHLPALRPRSPPPSPPPGYYYFSLLNFTHSLTTNLRRLRPISVQFLVNFLLHATKMTRNSCSVAPLSQPWRRMIPQHFCFYFACFSFV
jgi:hypothetical protein